MRINTASKIYTHEGAPAKKINVKQQLRRSLMSCMLWEKSFYESGEDIATRILNLADQCDAKYLAELAVEARTAFKLRHAPLLILVALIKKGGNIVSKAIEDTINRPDEITELVAIYWKDGKRPLSKQMKIGLGRAFLKFNEYQLAKWNRPGDIKLRDVLFLTHAKPTKDKEALFKKLAETTLETPNTWESRMAAGENKKEVFTDLLSTGKLGYMALLRNLRGMLEVGVDQDLIKSAISKPAPSVLPFRFISAARHAPRLERDLDAAMIKILDDHSKLEGNTIILVDVSYSMTSPLSSKSDLRCIDAANGLAILLSGICDSLRVLTFSNQVVEVPARSGMALGDVIWGSQSNGGTALGNAVRVVDQKCSYDRLIVITDEQSRDRVPDPKGLGYMINVSTNKNGVGYGPWVHIDGFSEACIDFIQEYETTNNK